MLAVVFLVLATASAQAKTETITHEPQLDGEHASAPIPAQDHIRNDRGSNGLGLCVIASTLCNGVFQQIPALADGKKSDYWQTALARPGGYSSGKLIALAQEKLPGEKYASIESATEDDLDRISSEGYPIGAVMGYGDRYPGRISHMVSLIHYRKGGRACVVDNNYPGDYSWMDATGEFFQRFQSNGSWCWVWTRKPAIPVPPWPLPVVVGSPALLVLGAALLLMSGFLLLVAVMVVVFARRPAV